MNHMGNAIFITLEDETGIANAELAADATFQQIIGVRFAGRRAQT